MAHPPAAGGSGHPSRVTRVQYSCVTQARVPALLRLRRAVVNQVEPITQLSAIETPSLVLIDGELPMLYSTSMLYSAAPWKRLTFKLQRLSVVNDDFSQLTNGNMIVR